jgi:SAM-dependent methyltransferase
MPDSHISARILFDTVAETYQERCEARVYNFSSLIFHRRINLVKQLLRRVAKRGKVLDYGMGPAVFGQDCLNLGLHYVGVDISPEMVRRAQQSLGSQGAEFVVGDLDSLRRYDQQMDVVLTIGLLDYLENPYEGIEALASCVKSDGYIILSFRNRFSLPRILRDTAKTLWRLLPQRPTWHKQSAFAADVHEHAFDPARDLQPHLKRLGFGEFEVLYFNCSPFFFNFRLPAWLWRGWSAMDSRLAGRFTRLLCSGGVLAGRRIEGAN